MERRISTDLIFFYFVIGFALRVALGVYMPEIVEQTWADKHMFHHSAKLVSFMLDADQPNPWNRNHWVNLIGIIYYTLWPERMLIVLFNSILGSISAVMIYYIIFDIYKKENIARLSFYFALFMPACIFLSANMIKEQIVGFLLVLVISGVVMKKSWGWAAVISGLVGLYLFRVNLFFMVGGLLGMYWLISVTYIRRITLGVKILFGALMVVGVTLGGAYMGATESFQTSKIKQILWGDLEKENVETIRDSRATFATYIDRDRVLSVKNVTLPPIRSMYFPHPLRFLKGSTPYYVFEGVALTFFLHLMMPFFLLGLIPRQPINKHWILVGTYALVFLLAAYSILTVYGQSFRYRWSVFPLFFAIAAYGWYGDNTRWRKGVFFGWWGSDAAITALYFL